MQPKLIKSILSRKIKHWANAVRAEDPAVADLIEKNTVVMGGSVASMLLNEKVNDFDVYMRTEEAAYKVAMFYIKKFAKIKKIPIDEGGTPGVDAAPQDHDPYLKRTHEPQGFKCYIKSAGVIDVKQDLAYRYFENSTQEVIENYFGQVTENNAAFTPMKEDAEKPEKGEEKEGLYSPRYVTQNAITLGGDVQLVLRFFGEPETILQYFDYEHCKMYYCSWDGYLHMTTSTLECLMNRRLVYTGSKYPICSLFRIRKFLERGFTINAGQIVKMCLQLNELDLTDLDVLEDQLIGVDHAYFVEILALFRDHQKDGKPFDGTYLMQLLDTYF